MYQLEMERGLLKRVQNRPAFAPLFQLPPRIGKRYPAYSPKLFIALRISYIRQ